jgi:CRISPR-associated protein Csm1
MGPLNDCQFGVQQMTIICSNEFDDLLRPVFLAGFDEIRNWFDEEDSPYLRAIFDQIGIMKGDVREPYYTIPQELTSHLRYPECGNADLLKKAKNEFYEEVTHHYEALRSKYLEKLTVSQLLFLLERIGGTIPCHENEEESVLDVYKIRAAKKVIENNDNSSSGQVSGRLLLKVDVSGIQRFIYSVSSSGALKSIRSRSFFVELLCNHAISAVISKFHLHPVNNILTGGGNGTILSNRPPQYEEWLRDIDFELNSWLVSEFNGDLLVVFSAIECTENEIAKMPSQVLGRLSEESLRQKNRRFSALIEKSALRFVENDDPGSRTCDSCSKDYEPKQYRTSPDAPGPFRCETCERFTRIGSLVPRVKYLYISPVDAPGCLRIAETRYLLSNTKLPDLIGAWIIFRDGQKFLDELVDFGQPLLMGSHVTTVAELPHTVKATIDKERAELSSQLKAAKDSTEAEAIHEELTALSEENPATLEHLASAAQGKALIGSLRMDADNLGIFFEKGFSSTDRHTLERIVCFSRTINYFFRIHVTELCRHTHPKEQNKKRFVHLTYSGGDDLFLLGAWNDVVELGIDIEGAFSKYACKNPDLSISGGFTLHKPKHPVSRMARQSLMALEAAKRDFEPCWFCHTDWLNCPLFSDGECHRKGSIAPFFTEYKSALKSNLDRQFRKRHLSEPSRIKLTFKRQRFRESNENPIDEIEQYILKPYRFLTDKRVQRSGRAFERKTFELLDRWYSEGLLYLPQIAWLVQRQRLWLGSVVESESGTSSRDLYDQYFHIAKAEGLSSLHVPLTWSMLLRKEGE